MKDEPGRLKPGGEGPHFLAPSNNTYLVIRCWGSIITDNPGIARKLARIRFIWTDCQDRVNVDSLWRYRLDL